MEQIQISGAPANDNALADYLGSDTAQLATLRTLLTVVRLAKCAPLSAAQLERLQLALEQT